MSLTTCPDCGREVSSTAAACPHCGYAFNPARTAADEGAPPVTPEARERVVYKKRRVSFTGILMGLLVVALLVVAVLWYMGVLRFV